MKTLNETINESVNYDAIKRNIEHTNASTEKANQKRAAKFYDNILIPKLEESVGSKCIKVRWGEYDRPGGKQSRGIDGCFIFEDGTVLNFQEKTHLNNTLSSTKRWSTIPGDNCHVIEIVNHGGGIGWIGHAKNVSIFSIFYKDCVVVIMKDDLSNLIQLSELGEQIYSYWVGSGSPQKLRVTHEGTKYWLNSVADDNTTSKTVITNLPETVITKQLKYSIETYNS